MNTFYLLNTIAVGGIFLVLLFGFCFFTVHLLKLAKRGYDETVRAKKSPPPTTQKGESEQEKKPEQKTPEPVYYIVEKKKKPPKSSYSEPKEFRFK